MIHTEHIWNIHNQIKELLNFSGTRNPQLNKWDLYSCVTFHPIEKFLQNCASIDY